MLLNIGTADNDGTGDPLRDAGRKLNALTHVLSAVTDVPAVPAAYDAYIIPTGATGAWLGLDGDVAWYTGTAWETYAPVEGWRFWVQDTNQFLAYDGSGWTAEIMTSLKYQDSTPLVNYKRPVRVAAYSNVDVATGGLVTIDGVTVAAGDRVALLVQTTATENGIWIASAGAWSRATDADTSAKLVGAHFTVSEGTSNSGALRISNWNQNNVLGTDTFTAYGIITEQGGYMPDNGLILYDHATGTKFITFDASTMPAGTGVFSMPYTLAGTLALEMSQPTIDTAGITLSDSDFIGGVTRRVNSATGVNVTVNTGLTLKQPCNIIQLGAGQLTFAGTATIQQSASLLHTYGQYAVATLIPDADTADLYYLTGDLA